MVKPLFLIRKNPPSKYPKKLFHPSIIDGSQTLVVVGGSNHFRKPFFFPYSFSNPKVHGKIP
jgi:hypothetical protein